MQDGKNVIVKDIRVDQMRHSDESRYDWFHAGLKEEYSICCILFFMFEFQSINHKNSEYADDMDGYIRCPDCVIKKIGKYRAST